MITQLMYGVIAGILATLAMDIGGTLARIAGVTAPMSPRLTGKWMAYVLRGQLRHSDIATSPEVPVPMPLVGVAHYVIGIVLALAYLTLLNTFSVQSEHFWLAVLYGIVTTIFPWFLLFPAMGYGPFGVKAPPEHRLLHSSLVNHTIYGIGLGLSIITFGPSIFY